MTSSASSPEPCPGGPPGSAVLPPLPDRLGPLALAASYDSAAAEAAIGGDTDAAELTDDHGVRLLLADVRGHGLDAVLFTDGAPEARRPSDGGFFAFERAVAAHLADGDLRQGLADLRASLLSWTGSALHDDVTVLLVVEFRP